MEFNPGNLLSDDVIWIGWIGLDKSHHSLKTTPKTVAFLWPFLILTAAKIETWDNNTKVIQRLQKVEGRWTTI